MTDTTKNPRILIVTPEVTYLPEGMGNMANYLKAKAGGLADVSAALVSALFEHGADVHVALPDYRTIFSSRLAPLIAREFQTIRTTMPEDRIHLAEDRIFFYLNRVYADYSGTNIKVALAFQREVINNIIPRVRPDLIHCNDWMTGLIPAMARQAGIPCLITLHNIFSMKVPLEQIEEVGIDAAAFWRQLYYDLPPSIYEEIRSTNPVDLLASGVFAAHFVNTVSHTFLEEIVQGRHDFVEEPLRREIAGKWEAGCAVGILNAPDPSYDPGRDEALARTYGPKDHAEGKRENKRFLQESIGLVPDEEAPLFFWPSRLDTVQKGCQLLADILYPVLSRYRERNLQVVIVSNGAFEPNFREIIKRHGLQDRMAICDFNEQLSRLAYAASDFILMPSRFEPCGLPQMIGPVYGTLPVAHDTGGIHDTVSHLDVGAEAGSGFLFGVFDANGLTWAIDQAMAFHGLPPEVKERQVERIMKQSAATFNHAVTARHYMDLYEKMLRRPLVSSHHF